jgi:hypothetical protein
MLNVLVCLALSISALHTHEHKRHRHAPRWFKRRHHDRRLTERSLERSKFETTAVPPKVDSMEDDGMEGDDQVESSGPVGVPGEPAGAVHFGEMLTKFDNKLAEALSMQDFGAGKKHVPILLLKREWLLDKVSGAAQPDFKMNRRQDLDASAFATPEQALEALGRGDRSIGFLTYGGGMIVIPSA